MECRWIRSRFTDYVDGDCAPAMQEAITRHLADCPDCTTALAEQVDFLDDCRALLTSPEPAYSFDALRQRMAEIESLDEIRLFLPKVQVYKGLPRYVVAALLMLMLGIAPLPFRTSRQGDVATINPFTQRLANIELEMNQLDGREILDENASDPMV